MNKLSNQIRATLTHAARPMGFGPARETKSAGGVLIAALGDALNGADILIVPADCAADLASLAQNAGGATVGVEPAELTPNGVAAVAEAGAQFVVWQPDSARADALLNPRLDYVLRLATDALPDESTLRALSSLRPTLVIAAAATDPYSVTALLALRRSAMLVGAPVAVPVTAEVSAGLLQALRDSGVAVVLLAQPTAAEIDALRARFAALPERPRRRTGDEEAMVPSVQPGADLEEFGEEDGDD